MYVKLGIWYIFSLSIMVQYYLYFCQTHHFIIAFITDSPKISQAFQQCLCRGVGRGVSLGSGNPLQVQYITQNYTSDITNDINDQTFEAQYSLSV